MYLLQKVYSVVYTIQNVFSTKSIQCSVHTKCIFYKKYALFCIYKVYFLQKYTLF